MTPDEFAEFSPPCGDRTFVDELAEVKTKFSPPYGDRTEIAAYKALTA